MRRTRSASAAIAVLLVVTGLTACEPPPPRAQLRVTSTAFGRDGNPGDGVCQAPWANYRCTFLAAIDEANALGAADILLPAGVTYGPTPDPISVTITGDVAIRGTGTPTTPQTDSQLAPYVITVARGARLRMTDLASFHFSRVHLLVEGRIDLDRFFLGGFDAALTVRAGGTAIVTDSHLAITSDLQVAGTLVVARSSLRARRVELLDGGAMVTAASILEVDACAAPPPRSLGHNRVESATCATDSTDSVGVPAADLGVWSYPGNDFLNIRAPKATSALVDAIPLGTAGCSTSLVDIRGEPRGGDGNGDGVPGCDVGPIELAPATPT